MFQRIINVVVLVAFGCGVVFWFAISNTMGNAVSALLINKLSAVIGVPAATITGRISDYIIPFLVGLGIFAIGRFSVDF
jgi:hypothetical protein